MIFILSNLRIEAVFSGILNGHDPWRISLTSVDSCALSSQHLFCCPRMTWRRDTLGSSSRVENGFCRQVRSPLRSLIPGTTLGELHLIPGPDIFSVAHLLLWVWFWAAFMASVFWFRQDFSLSLSLFLKFLLEYSWFTTFVSFCCTTKWFSYTLHIPTLF